MQGSLTQWFGLEGRVALVTGAGRGLGAGYASALAAAGAFVVCVGRRIDSLEKTVAQIHRDGGRATAFPADVTRPALMREIIDRVVKDYGSLDILVNNAGTEIAKGIQEVAEKDYDTIMGTNLKGLYFTAQAAANHMIRRRRGKIINIGSLASQIGIAGSTVYSASKGGVLQFTRALAVELAPYNIQVNAIGPGYFRTEMTEPFFQDPEHRQWIEQRIPMGRVGTAADLAATVVFLAGPGADYITGQIIYVDGGWLAS
ncbi:glucose 1-dehydrogenase [Desulfofundulus thermobenzoicus]|uniref:Glucose 1-dehydrogenase n=1 Tax=Desulfofundulus thermobenzoicus TaxID=29376 RepID=A0A6N7IQI0_9FIRM|nr:glucose 1-dehydrogenase [Desulfofundulus thermobenzoicus]MQL52284.1 glucose 1-dehydrogenase [Desulfofundulus thermobenzoicus]